MVKNIALGATIVGTIIIYKIFLYGQIMVETQKEKDKEVVDLKNYKAGKDYFKTK